MIELQIRYFPSEADFEMAESLFNMMCARLEEKQDDTRRTNK
jgi:isocitrate dehydrogenase kinase/phosphatase